MTLTDIETTCVKVSHCHSKPILNCQQMVFNSAHSEFNATNITSAQVVKMITHSHQQSFQFQSNLGIFFGELITLSTLPIIQETPQYEISQKISEVFHFFIRLDLIQTIKF